MSKMQRENRDSFGRLVYTGGFILQPEEFIKELKKDLSKIEKDLDKLLTRKDKEDFREVATQLRHNFNTLDSFTKKTMIHKVNNYIGQIETYYNDTEKAEKLFKELEAMGLR